MKKDNIQTRNRKQNQRGGGNTSGSGSSLSIGGVTSIPMNMSGGSIRSTHPSNSTGANSKIDSFHFNAQTNQPLHHHHHHVQQSSPPHLAAAAGLQFASFLLKNGGESYLHHPHNHLLPPTNSSSPLSSSSSSSLSSSLNYHQTNQSQLVQQQQQPQQFDFYSTPTQFSAANLQNSSNIHGNSSASTSSVTGNQYQAYSSNYYQHGVSLI